MVAIKNVFKLLIDTIESKLWTEGSMVIGTIALLAYTDKQEQKISVKIGWVKVFIVLFRYLRFI
jgi:hypothetical protein